jgi:hypothetical protein
VLRQSRDRLKIEKRRIRRPIVGCRETSVVSARRPHGDRLWTGRVGSERLHPRPRASSSRTEFRLSARHHHPARRAGEFERLRRRLDLVRCRLGRQSRLGIRQLPVLRLPEPPGSRDRVRSAARHRHRGVQSRRLLGPLLRRSTVVWATRLLDVQAAAPAPPAPAAVPATTPGATESAAAASSPATPAEAAGDAPTRAAKPAPPESRQGSQALAP